MNCTECKYMTTVNCQFHNHHKEHYCTFYPRWVNVGIACGQIGGWPPEAHWCSNFNQKVEVVNE